MGSEGEQFFNNSKAKPNAQERKDLNKLDTDERRFKDSNQSVGEPNPNRHSRVSFNEERLFGSNSADKHGLSTGFFNSLADMFKASTPTLLHNELLFKQKVQQKEDFKEEAEEEEKDDGNVQTSKQDLGEDEGEDDSQEQEENDIVQSSQGQQEEEEENLEETVEKPEQELEEEMPSKPLFTDDVEHEQPKSWTQPIVAKVFKGA